MKKYCEAFFLMILFLFAGNTVSLANDNIVSNLLDTLDVALKQRTVALDKRQNDANALVQRVNQLPDGLEKAQGYCDACEAYMHICSDSTIKYALKNYDISVKIKDPKQILNARLDLLKSYTRRGEMGKAYEVLSDIGVIDKVPEDIRQKYAYDVLDFYIRLQSENDAYSSPTLSAQSAWNYCSKFITSGTPLYYFYQGTCSGHLDLDNALSILSETENPSFDYAKLSYAIAREYSRRNNQDKYYEYLLRSAICDARVGNAEVQSLLLLLQTPLLAKDTKRSYDYVQVLVDNITRYRDMNRALKVVEIQNNINKQFNKDKNMCIIVAAVAVLLFLIALVFCMIQIRLLKNRNKRTNRIASK